MTTRRMATTGPRPLVPADEPRPVVVRLAAALAWLALLVGTIWLLGRLGRGALSTPPLLDRAELQLWLEGRDAVTVAFALLRLVGLVLAWYLLAVSVVGLAARASRVPALVRVADLATVPAVRRVLGTVAGVGLTASAASLAAAGLLPDQPSTGAGGGGAPVVLERVPDGDEVILQRLPDEEGTATMRQADPEPAPAEAPGPREWTAEPGDSFWHVAEAALGEAWGRPPTAEEVTPYWTVVVEANRPLLSDPANPDLIFPGQVFRLPEPPPAP